MFWHYKRHAFINDFASLLGNHYICQTRFYSLPTYKIKSDTLFKWIIYFSARFISSDSNNCEPGEKILGIPSIGVANYFSSIIENRTLGVSSWTCFWGGFDSKNFAASTRFVSSPILYREVVILKFFSPMI